MAEPGRDDDCGGRAHLGRLCHHVRHRGRRSRDDDQIGRPRKLRQIPEGMQAFDLMVLRVDEPQGAGPPGAAQIVEDRPADRFFPRARADQRDRTGNEQAIKAIGRHDSDHVTLVMNLKFLRSLRHARMGTSKKSDERARRDRPRNRASPGVDLPQIRQPRLAVF